MFLEKSKLSKMSARECEYKIKFANALKNFKEEIRIISILALTSILTKWIVIGITTRCGCRHSHVITGCNRSPPSVGRAGCTYLDPTDGIERGRLVVGPRLLDPPCPPSPQTGRPKGNSVGGCGRVDPGAPQQGWQLGPQPFVFLYSCPRGPAQDWRRMLDPGIKSYLIFLLYY